MIETKHFIFRCLNMDKLRPFKKQSVCLGMKCRVLLIMRVFNFTNILIAQRVGARVCTLTNVFRWRARSQTKLVKKYNVWNCSFFLMNCTKKYTWIKLQECAHFPSTYVSTFSFMWLLEHNLFLNNLFIFDNSCQITVSHFLHLFIHWFGSIFLRSSNVHVNKLIFYSNLVFCSWFCYLLLLFFSLKMFDFFQQTKSNFVWNNNAAISIFILDK